MPVTCPSHPRRFPITSPFTFPSHSRHLPITSPSFFRHFLRHFPVTPVTFPSLPSHYVTSQSYVTSPSHFPVTLFPVTFPITALSLSPSPPCHFLQSLPPVTFSSLPCHFPGTFPSLFCHFPVTFPVTFCRFPAISPPLSRRFPVTFPSLPRHLPVTFPSLSRHILVTSSPPCHFTGAFPSFPRRLPSHTPVTSPVTFPLFSGHYLLSLHRHFHVFSPSLSPTLPRAFPRHFPVISLPLSRHFPVTFPSLPCHLPVTFPSLVTSSSPPRHFTGTHSRHCPVTSAVTFPSHFRCYSVTLRRLSIPVAYRISVLGAVLEWQVPSFGIPLPPSFGIPLGPSFWNLSPVVFKSARDKCYSPLWAQCCECVFFSGAAAFPTGNGIPIKTSDGPRACFFVCCNHGFSLQT